MTSRGWTVERAVGAIRSLSLRRCGFRPFDRLRAVPSTVEGRLQAEGSRLVLALTLVLVQAAAAGAQEQPSPQAQDRGGRGGQVVRPAELAAMLDAYTLMQAQNALQLSDAQYAPFVTRLKRFQENRRRNTQIRNRLLQELRMMTAPNTAPDENLLKEKLRALREHNVQMAATLQRDSEALDEILDVPQQVRFRLLEERVERQKLDLLMLSRRRVPPASEEGRKPR